MPKLSVTEATYIIERLVYVLCVIAGLLVSVIAFFATRVLKKTDDHETRISTVEGKCESNHKGD